MRIIKRKRKRTRKRVIFETSHAVFPPRQRCSTDFDSLKIFSLIYKSALLAGESQEFHDAVSSSPQSRSLTHYGFPPTQIRPWLSFYYEFDTHRRAAGD